MEYFKEIEERVILVGVQMNDGEDTEDFRGAFRTCKNSRGTNCRNDYTKS